MDATYTLEAHVAALIAEGYEVTFAAGDPATAYWCHLDKKDDAGAGSTAGGKTLGEALWTASPLHGDDEPYPGAGLDFAALTVLLRDHYYNLGYQHGRKVPVDVAEAMAIIGEARDGLSALLAAAE